MVAQGSISQSDPIPTVTKSNGAGPVLSPRSQRSIEQIAAGLAKIAIEPTQSSILAEAVGLLSRLPAVATVAVIRPDDSGLLTLTYQVGQPMDPELASFGASAIHQQWIASHARDGSVTGPAPFALPTRDDVL